MDPMPVSLACPLTSVSWELGAGGQLDTKPVSGRWRGLRITWGAGTTTGTCRSQPPGFSPRVRSRLAALLSPMGWMPYQKRAKWSLRGHLRRQGWAWSLRWAGQTPGPQSGSPDWSCSQQRTCSATSWPRFKGAFPPTVPSLSIQAASPLGPSGTILQSSLRCSPSREPHSAIRDSRPTSPRKPVQTAPASGTAPSSASRNAAAMTVYLWGPRL